MDKALIPVSFHGDSLFIVDHCGEPFTPMKPIVEGMGLAWGAQQQKLSANRERWGISIFDIPTASGIQQAVCMPVRKLPAYFGTICPNKVRTEIRAKIVLYQNECDDALWKYWTGQQVEREQPATICSGLDVATRLPFYSDQTEPDELECHFAAIKGHVRAIREIEREVFRIVKDGMRPALLAVSTPRRAVAIQAHTAMERLFYSLDYGLEAAEATVRSALIASRM